MRVPSSTLAALSLLATASAFVPHSIRSASSTTTPRFGVVDPSLFHDLPHQVQHAFTLLADADLDSLTDAATAAVAPASDAVTAAADVAGEVAKKDSGWFGFLTEPISMLLQGIHSVLNVGGMNTNSWGVSIVALTVLIKVVTFPLTKTQLESTNKMQALQPAIKEVQAKYQSNPEVMNQKVADLYQQNDVNPLAGCLPSLVQIPVFIGLYRAVLELAQQNALDEPFLFLPNLEGPTYGADPAHGTDWLFQGWVDGVPALGWDDTIAFVALPIFLVISQVISMNLMQPKDPAQQQNNVVLKILPVMIGWFALNVPAALTIYWVVNNIVTTATTLAIRNSMDLTPAGASGGAAVAEPTPSTIFAPPREKPAGFASPAASEPPVVDVSGVKPLTSIQTAEVVDVVIEEEAAVAEADVASEAGTGMQSSDDTGGSKKKRGKKRKKKKN
ncbi:Membrane protein insertase YidC [Seminavis robusta]|uniref:Membrane protein insertase YidC n=1 Tax=Seminavis robusta TaxID=568900 RepID=A0A9N8DXX6_9STRA|nr:Membrane protein insertase YidC [Seminavis robusta]|eukprot:Sro461_g147740.1 Membrane protein insertase YidC (445) ;mRNA; r:26759-28421